MGRKKRTDRKLLVGLDIGTSKITALVGELKDNGAIELLGMGSNPSRGMKKGVVVNIDSTVDSIRRAVEEAELMAGAEINAVYTGVAGSHIRGLNSHGIAQIRDRVVNKADIKRVMDAAQAVAFPADQRLLHVIPQYFVVDGHEGIQDPIGMSGVRLEAHVHIVTGAESAVQNIVKCVQACGIHVQDIVLEQWASSYSVLTEDEKDLGVCLLDIGHGTTDVAAFRDGALRHTSAVPVAGDQASNDIATQLRTPRSEAEGIKIRHGCALMGMVRNGETIEVPGTADQPTRHIQRVELAEILEMRYQELFEIVREDLRRRGLEEQMASGIVLTGGSSKLEGAVELAERIFELPVRLGRPTGVSGPPEIVNNPVNATGVGLLLYARQQCLKHPDQKPLSGNARKIFQRMRSWFQGNF
jgi:cell division protein FtsA